MKKMILAALLGIVSASVMYGEPALPLIQRLIAGTERKMGQKETPSAPQNAEGTTEETSKK